MSRRIIRRAIATLTLTALAVLPTVGTASATTSMDVRAMDIALTKKGDPYVSKATGPSEFDCSGLVVYSYKRAGYKYATRGWFRTAQDQYNHTHHISYRYRRPGDLVFFGHGTHDIFHVGIYIGVHKWYGKWRSLMIAAAYPGAGVRVEPIYENWDKYDTVVFGRV